MSEHIEDLQARIAFQEDTIQTLNQQVADLNNEMQALQRQMHLLYKRVDDLVYQLEQSQSAPSPLDERPPHY